MSRMFQHPDGDPVRRVRRGFRVRAVRACRVTVWVAAITFALVGALTAPPYVVLLAAPVFGGFVGSMVALINPSFPKARSARRGVVLSGAGGALVPPALSGLGEFGTAGLLAAVVLLVLVCALVSGWIVEQSCPPERQAASGFDVQELHQFIQVLPTSMLLREWRSTGEHVRAGADPDRRAEAVLVRNLLLEELSRRDPVGVGRWLSEGDEDAPEQYLRGDSDATT